MKRNVFDKELDQLIAANYDGGDWHDLTDTIDEEHQTELAAARGRSTERAEANARYEDRLIRFVREPLIETEPDCPPELWYVHETVWENLAGTRSKKFHRLLLMFLSESSPECIRLEAIRSISHMALDSSAARVVRWLCCDDPKVVSAAIWGTYIAFTTEQAMSAEYRTKLARAFASILQGMTMKITSPLEAETMVDPDEGCVVFNWACEILLAWDFDRVAELLTQPECFADQNPAFGDLVAMLAGRDRHEEQHPPTPIIPASSLWPAYERVQSGKSVWSSVRGDQISGDLLVLLAKSDAVGLRKEANRLVAAKSGASKQLRSQARRAKLIAAEVPDPEKIYLRFIKDPQTLKGKARQVLMAFGFADHLLSDGVNAYFLNLGYEYQNAVKGLNVLGQTAVASDLDATGDRFWGSRKPSEVNLDKLIKSFGDEKALDAFMHKVCPSPSKLESQANSIIGAVRYYIAKHLEQFK
jgi:hypothetical protein